MFKYFQSLLKLAKIRFEIENCQDIYFLQNILNTFMKAEGKRFQNTGSNKYVTPKPLRRPLIVSRLPQFSEAIHEQIKIIREKHDAKLSKVRIIKERPQGSCPVVGKFASPEHRDNFFQKNEALFLTHPKYIPGVDFTR